MKPFKATFLIVEDNNCPLYKSDDIITLTEKVISFPNGKDCCLILVREMTELLFQFLSERDAGNSPDLSMEYTCSGCDRLIKFVRTTNAQTPSQIISEDPAVISEKESTLLTAKEQKLFDTIVNNPLLRAIPPEELKNNLDYFKTIIVKKGSLLIKKGYPNSHLFILLSGSVIVEDGAVPIARLGLGELCGEMSYFGNNIATTSVRTLENSKLLAINGKDFGKLIKLSDSVNSFMVRLLAKRLSHANTARANDFDLSMQGRINDMAPVELMQIFHMHQKTGILSLELPRGPGQISFVEGAIVVADYDGKNGQDAVFAIIAERDGVYSFTAGLPPQVQEKPAIGDFMMLLMEGVKRADEK